MAGLLDIALATEEVNGVTVTGVSAAGVAYLLSRYPEIRLLMSGREVNITPDQIIMLAPGAIAAIIAVGCGIVPTGKDDDAERQTEAELRASMFPVELQADFLAAIIRVTMPGGIGPFVAKLEKLGGIADGFGNIAVTKSAPQS